MNTFLLRYFVPSWPAFAVGLVLGAVASCRTYSNVVEGIIVVGAATVIAACTVAEYRALRHARKELLDLREEIRSRRAP